jgi:hypothetical protein
LVPAVLISAILHSHRVVARISEVQNRPT